MIPRDILTEPQNLPEPGWDWRRYWKRGVGAIVGLLLILALIMIWNAMTPEEEGPRLTYEVKRGRLAVTITEEGLLESAKNTEIKCRVRGKNTVLWVIASGTVVKPGDELVRLDSLEIEEQIDERTKFAHWSRSSAERSEASLTRAELAVDEYEKGRYIAEKMALEKDLVIAQAHLKSAMNILKHAKMMARNNYVSDLEIEEKEFMVEQAKLNVDFKTTELEVLEKFTQAEQVQTLSGNLASIGATHKANVERAMADASRRDRALEEIQHCVVRAERAGLVIHPNAAKWELRPIEEGATVHKDQVLLLMPDLSQMRVKVGVHESVIDRMKPGLKARVSLPDQELIGEVAKVASVTKPAGWWTGNEVRYDMQVSVPNQSNLRPGMSAQVEVLIAEYEDVLMIPVAAIVETASGPACWVKSKGKAKRRNLVLGDTNDMFTIVEGGLKEGEQVVLNPMAYREAQIAAAQEVGGEPTEGETSDEDPTARSDEVSKPNGESTN